MHRARAFAWILVAASCGKDGGGGQVLDMGPVDAAAPDIGVGALVCPFDDEPACGPTDPCPKGDWICVQNDPPDELSTCRLPCDDNSVCEVCTRVCVTLVGGSGGVCVVGTGPGEPCSPEPCNPGLDCIVPDDNDPDHAFCRTRCASGMPCVEEHFQCSRRTDGEGYVCGPYFGTLVEGEDCTDSASWCETGLLCATHGGGTTCVPMCYPDLAPDGCDDSDGGTGETCQRVADEDGDPIGYGCL